MKSIIQVLALEIACDNIEDGVQLIKIDLELFQNGFEWQILFQGTKYFSPLCRGIAATNPNQSIQKYNYPLRDSENVAQIFRVDFLAHHNTKDGMNLIGIYVNDIC